MSISKIGICVREKCSLILIISSLILPVCLRIDNGVSKGRPLLTKFYPIWFQGFMQSGSCKSEQPSTFRWFFSLFLYCWGCMKVIRKHLAERVSQLRSIKNHQLWPGWYGGNQYQFVGSYHWHCEQLAPERVYRIAMTASSSSNFVGKLPTWGCNMTSYLGLSIKSANHLKMMPVLVGKPCSKLGVRHWWTIQKQLSLRIFGWMPLAWNDHWSYMIIPRWPSMIPCHCCWLSITEPSTSSSNQPNCLLSMNFELAS